MLSLFQLLRCKIPELQFYPGTGESESVTDPSCAHTPRNGFAVWHDFEAEMNGFLQGMYSQPDTAPEFTNPVLRHLGRISNEEGVAANTYAWITVAFEELSAEYVRRYGQGNPLCFSWPLVRLTGVPDFVAFVQPQGQVQHIQGQVGGGVGQALGQQQIQGQAGGVDGAQVIQVQQQASFKERIKGLFEVKRPAVLNGTVSSIVTTLRETGARARGWNSVWRKMTTQIAGYIRLNIKQGAGLISCLGRSYFFLLTDTPDSPDKLYIGGPVDSSVPGSPTVYEAMLFFIHLMLSNRHVAAAPLDRDGGDGSKRGKRPNSTSSSSRPSKMKRASQVVMKRSERVAQQGVIQDYRFKMMHVCQAAGFDFDEIQSVVKYPVPEDVINSSYEYLHTGNSVLFRGMYKGKKCVVKMLRVATKLMGLLIEVHVLNTRLKELQGIVVPRILTAGFYGGGFTTVFEDRGAKRLEDKVDVRYDKATVLKTIEALEMIHSKGVLHGQIEPSHIIQSESGEVMWIDFSLAAMFNDINSDRFLTLRRLEEETINAMPCE